jgi:hypothetical protein
MEKKQSSNFEIHLETYLIVKLFPFQDEGAFFVV